MLALTDHQLKIVIGIARLVAPERRSQFLERVGAMLKLRGRFSDSDVNDVCVLAATGLTLVATDTDAA